MPRTKRPCDFCGKDMTGKKKYHVGGDIDDATVCSEACIKEYSEISKLVQSLVGVRLTITTISDWLNAKHSPFFKNKYRELFLKSLEKI